MRWITVLLFALVVSGAAAGDASRTSEILDRLHHANDWRGHVMVVAHRTGWRENGVYRFPDNSLTGIRNAISLGVEMVELDVRKTADGVPVLMHDEWVDRTTTCHGQLVSFTFAALQSCRLVIDGSRRVTEEHVPRFEDALSITRDRLLVNVDNKLDVDFLPEIAAVARRIGVSDQILIKQNVWNDERIATVKSVLKKLGPDVPFMPILADDAVVDSGFMAKATRAFAAPAAELVHWHEDAAPVTADGGPLFRPKARAAAIRGNWHLWVNIYPIVNRADGVLAGGRGDGLAAVDPDASYGFWIEHGVTIIQTDEPKATLRWLTAHGYRTPYAADRPQALAQKTDGEQKAEIALRAGADAL